MGRPNKYPPIPEDSVSAAAVEGKGKGKHVEEAPAEGRKKRVATDKPPEGSARKRAKFDATPNELLKTEEVVVKVAKKSIRTKSTIVAPKWKIVLNSVKEPGSTNTKTETSSTVKTLKPRIWTGSREELLALLPDLAGTKCFNGISWYKYPTPMVVLDDTNPCFEVERQEAQPLCLDLVTTRSFVCPIPKAPSDSNQDLVCGVQPSNPSEIHQQASKAKAPVIRKAPRYGVPKSLAGSNITSKVEYVPPTPVTEPSTFAHVDPFMTAPAPPNAVHAGVLRSEEVTAPHPPNAGTLPGTLTSSLRPSSATPSNNDPVEHHDSRLLPNSWKQISELEGKIDKILYQAKQTYRNYRPGLATSIPIASAPVDGLSTYPYVVPHRLSVQSVRSIPRASSSKVTLDPGAYEYQAISGHTPATTTMQAIHAPHDSNPSTSFNPPSLQPDVSAKETTVQKASVPIIRDETPTEVILAPADAIPANTQQAATPQQESVPSIIEERMKRTDALFPDAMLAGIPSTAEHEETSVPVMIDETTIEMNLAAAGDMPPLTRRESEATANTNVHDIVSLDDFIPSQLPDEIAALVEAYLFGRPLSVMVSRDRLRESWGINVEKQFGYVMLGFFRILGIQESRVQRDNVKVSKLPNGACAGQVQWRFHLEWAPGGEEIILQNHPKDSFDCPWWDEKVKGTTPSASSETSTSSEAETREILSKDGDQADEPESRYPTTRRYREARIANHEYQFRHCPLSDAYDSVVPEQVLAPFGRQHSDRVFPRGWLCTKCGRLNFQQALRHRKCPSAFCKDESAPVDPYFYDLYWIRDPQERLPLNYPRNTYPPGIKVSHTKWKDGTQTFAYSVNENSNIFIKHIFLSNIGELQKPASNLMNKVQLTVPLLRLMTNNNPYFFYTAQGPKSNAAATEKPWDGVPDCINEAKKEVVGRTAWFAEVPEKLISVKHLKIVAWITEGSKRGNEVIRAKNKCSVLLAMGCTTMLTVTPRSLEKMKVAGAKSDPQEDAGEDVESGWVAVGGKVNEVPSAPAEDLGTPGPPAPDNSKKVRGAPRKKDRPSFNLSLYHGDMVVFYGDDFEYSFKRDGTSFMLFASHDEIV